MVRPDPCRSLRLLDLEQRHFCSDLAELTRSELEAPSNLPGWSVAELAIHLTRVCDSLLLAIQRAIVGDSTPVFGPTTKPREDEIRAMDKARWIDLQRAGYRDLSEIVGALTDDDLAQLMFPFGQGPRNVGWYCTQLLAEVAFHRWDLERSFGADRPLEDGLAAHLLSFLLDPEWPLFARRWSDSGLQTFGVTTEVQAWTLASTQQGTTVRLGAAHDAPRISAASGLLALALYGRVRVDGPGFTVSGPADTPTRYAAIFGPS